MRKSILYKLFKIGRIPKKVRPVLESEGIVACDEGLRGWIFMKDFRAPGKWFKYRRAGFSGFLAVTRKRVIAYTYWRPIINIDFDHPGISELELELVKPGKLVIAFEASVFNPEMKGRIEVSFHTYKAGEFYRMIRSFQQGS